VADLAWGAATHTGQVRAANEDHLHASNGVYVVADGMGGHEAGEVASELAVQRIRDVLTADDLAPTAQRVVDAITDANGDIFRAAIATPGQAGMGTTVTVIAVIEDPMAGRGAPNIDDNDGVPPERVTPVVPLEAPEALVLANVGDSRTYLFRHNRLRRVTVDHSYVQELVSSGHITDDEARTHPRRNIITRALGIEPDVRVDWWTLPLVRGDRFLLCSDGLVDEVSDEAIAEALRSISDPQAAVDSLVELANDAGGRDNITIIVVDVLDGDAPPDPTQELDLAPVWATEESELTADEIARIEAGLPRHDGDGDPDDDVVPPRRRGRRRRRRTTIDASSDAATTTAADSTSDSSTDSTGSGSDHPGDAAAEPPGEPVGRKAKRAARREAKDAPRLGRIIAVFVVLAVLVIAFVAVAAWARSGYFVDYDNDDQIVVYQGRPGGLLWFDPTAETTGSFSRDSLTDGSAELVDARPTFESEADAALFVSRLEVRDPDAANVDDTDGQGSSDDEPSTSEPADTEEP